MSKLKYFVPLVAMSLSVGVVADTAVGTSRNPDFLACKKAVEKHFKSPRRVDVKSTYWVTDRPGNGKRILVNAKFNRQPVRGTCDVSARGRVAELTVTSGRFVDSDQAPVELVQLND
jgi:hypothetical protein